MAGYALSAFSGFGGGGVLDAASAKTASMRKFATTPAVFTARALATGLPVCCSAKHREQSGVVTAAFPLCTAYEATIEIPKRYRSLRVRAQAEAVDSCLIEILQISLSHLLLRPLDSTYACKVFR